MNCIDLSGLWQCEIPGQTAQIRLPGTLDESGIGHPDSTEKQWHPENALAIVQKETGLVFAQVLEHAGVYKRTPEGEKAFNRFIETVNCEI